MGLLYLTFSLPLTKREQKINQGPFVHSIKLERNFKALDTKYTQERFILNTYVLLSSE